MIIDLDLKLLKPFQVWRRQHILKKKTLVHQSPISEVFVDRLVDGMCASVRLSTIPSSTAFAFDYSVRMNIADVCR